MVEALEHYGTAARGQPFRTNFLAALYWWLDLGTFSTREIPRTESVRELRNMSQSLECSFVMSLRNVRYYTGESNALKTSDLRRNTDETKELLPDDAAPYDIPILELWHAFQSYAGLRGKNKGLQLDKFLQNTFKTEISVANMIKGGLAWEGNEQTGMVTVHPGVLDDYAREQEMFEDTKDKEITQQVKKHKYDSATSQSSFWS